MFGRTNNICEYTFYPFYTSKEARNARRITNGTWLVWVPSSVRKWLSVCCAWVHVQDLWRIFTICFRNGSLFVSPRSVSNLKYEEQQSATGGLLSLVVSEGLFCLVIDSRDGIRWAGVMCQAANPNHLTSKNWAAPPAPCPITRTFSQKELWFSFKNSAKSGCDPCHVINLWLMPFNVIFSSTKAAKLQRIYSILHSFTCYYIFMKYTRIVTKTWQDGIG